jgi:AcrR family transcriptional regulator
MLVGMAQRAYHHGDLRRALLSAAVEAITESGPTALSLRDLARRAGVSHAAPTHHFGDKAGLLTALAAEGFDLLAGALTAVPPDPGGFLEVGVAYVRVAVEHRAHFEVMFRPDLYHADDPELVAARARSSAALYGGVAAAAPAAAAPAGWSPTGAAIADAASSGSSLGGPSSAGPSSAGAASSGPSPADPAVGASLAGAPLDADDSSESTDGHRDRAIREAGLAAWSLVHGFTTLWLSGALPAGLGDDPDAAARTILRRFPPVL